ncbi:DegT/DnrJ/EryC1/StrS family aminotransferase [Streptomyces sp. NPDC060048]|uniref:DegT/DnrJ/EryC1/StrS family aminotransferase n=1 Tax=unclassified Streptomyces TaxID=2593676 RepID=UPI003685156D
MTTLPFFPPDLFEEDKDALLKVLFDVGTDPEQRFILGRRTAEFEEEIKKATGAGAVLACGSGTGALELAVGALDIGPGDEVVVPAFCCQPVASAVVNAGATPVFADVDPWTMVMDPDHTESLITGRTKALLPAHLFSIMADMPRFMDISRRHGIPVIEDAAVAQGAVLDGVPAGRWGTLGAFSFFQVKALGTAGEGGVVLTDEPELATAVKMLRNHGQDGVNRFLHHRIGRNSRFDEVLAGFQLHRLAGFADRMERRAQIADYYTDRFAALADEDVKAPPAGRNGRCYYVYSLQVSRREDLRAYLSEHGIGSHVYYPTPLPLQPAFAAFAPEGADWPNARWASRSNLAIPVWPHLTDAEVEHIADTICDFFA